MGLLPLLLLLGLRLLLPPLELTQRLPLAGTLHSTTGGRDGEQDRRKEEEQRTRRRKEAGGGRKRQ